MTNTDSDFHLESHWTLSSMIVEFTGIPGTGKTTLLPIVKRHLRKRGLKAMSCDEAQRWCLTRTLLGSMIEVLPSGPSRELVARAVRGLVMAFCVLKFVNENPALLRYVILFQMTRNVSWLHFAMVLRSFLRTAGHYRFFRQHLEAGEAVVMDEGFVHRVVSLYVSELEKADPETVEHYLKLLPQVDLVIVIRAPLGICLERILRRRLPKRLQSLALSQVAQALDNMSGAIEVVSRQLGSRGWPTVEADNTRRLGASAASLNDRLNTAISNNLVSRICLGST